MATPKGATLLSHRRATSTRPLLFLPLAEDVCSRCAVAAAIHNQACCKPPVQGRARSKYFQPRLQPNTTVRHRRAVMLLPCLVSSYLHRSRRPGLKAVHNAVSMLAHSAHAVSAAYHTLVDCGLQQHRPSQITSAAQRSMLHATTACRTRCTAAAAPSALPRTASRVAAPPAAAARQLYQQL